MTDRVQVRFHPSLPEHGRQLVESLGVDVVFDDRAPDRCECDGCRAFRRFGTQSMSFERVRQLVRDGVCPRHDCLQPCAFCEEAGVEPSASSVIHARQREAVSPSTGAM